MMKLRILVMSSLLSIFVFSLLKSLETSYDQRMYFYSFVIVILSFIFIIFIEIYDDITKVVKSMKFEEVEE